MSNLQVGYYAKLVQRGNMLIEEIPADVKEAVLTFMNTGKLPEEKVAEPVQRMEIPTDTRKGSLILPEMSLCGISMQNLKDGVPTSYHGTNAVIFAGVADQPRNVRYEVALVENTSGIFEQDPEVNVITTTDGFDLMIKGRVASGANHRGKKILRVDLMIYTDNYHDMRITLYFAGV